MNIIHYKEFLADPRGAKAAEKLSRCRCNDPNCFLLLCTKCRFEHFSDAVGQCMMLLHYVEDDHDLHGLSMDPVTFTTQACLPRERGTAFKNVTVGSDVRLSLAEDSGRTMIVAKSIHIDFMPVLTECDPVSLARHLWPLYLYNEGDELSVTLEPVFLLPAVQESLLTNQCILRRGHEMPFVMTMKANSSSGETYALNKDGGFTKNLVKEFSRYFTSDKLIEDGDLRQIVLQLVEHTKSHKELLPLLQPVYDYLAKVEDAMLDASGLPVDVVKHVLMAYL
jgi:hypothetical protein